MDLIILFSVTFLYTRRSLINKGKKDTTLLSAGGCDGSTDGMAFLQSTGNMLWVP